MDGVRLIDYIASGEFQIALAFALPIAAAYVGPFVARTYRSLRELDREAKELFAPREGNLDVFNNARE
ncbi:MAG: hypothetical protein ABIH92_04280 [Nanoarchaeota archaeon]